MPRLPLLKIVSIFLLVLTSSIILSACSKLPISILDKSKNEAVNIEYWGLWDSQSTMDSIIGDYKKTKPNVNISYKKKSIQQYRESLSSQIDSGKGPDMFVFHNTWTPMLKDQLSPVPSSVVSASEIKNNFYPAVSQDLIANGKLVGLPTEVDGLELYYNEDVFKAAGIIKPPTTWSEFAQDAVKLTVRDSQGGIRWPGSCTA